MGGKYRVTGNTYPRMRRRGRRRIVLAALTGALVLGLLGWGTLQLIDVFLGDSGKAKAAAAKRECAPDKTSGVASAVPAVALPKPGQITVNVYNATPRSGLAKSVSEELKKRGFTVGKVGNAPPALDKKVPGTGILLGSPKTDKAVYSVLGAQLAGEKLQTDTRATADVDLILGTAFKELSPKVEVDTALAALAQPVAAPAPKC
ncbi:LytR C-terminal domain-containing protein [Streptomyces sp. NPDC006879]|uniref:LytR C-terminal domain-containing protein n=1 Tax=Streptomyces sp. NPDC006879 TaxID=3364767 RepID=UPI00368B4BEA